MSHQQGTNGTPLIRAAAVMLVVYAAINGFAGVSSAAFHVVFGLIGVAALFLAGTSGKSAPAVVRTTDPKTEKDVSAIVRTLGPAIDAGDPMTRGRSTRIAHFCRRVGEEFSLDEAQLRDLECAAYLHDIGRTASHMSVRLLKRKLRPEERKQVQSLPESGYQLLRNLPGLEGAAEIVYAHHEQPDGRGYPRQLDADGIPLASRILMAVIAFDAMTTDRPYRRGLSPDAAYAELRKCSGTMFFTEVVNALVSLHESDRIFEGFDESEMTRYASGQISSRAFEGYLARHPELVETQSTSSDAEEDVLDFGVEESERAA